MGNMRGDKLMSIYSDKNINAIEKICQKIISKYYNSQELQGDMQIILQNAYELDRQYQTFSDFVGDNYTLGA